MKDFEKQQGIAFLILYFSHRDEIYYMPFQEMYAFWERGAEWGKETLQIQRTFAPVVSAEDRQYYGSFFGGNTERFGEQIKGKINKKKN